MLYNFCRHLFPPCHVCKIPVSIRVESCSFGVGLIRNEGGETTNGHESDGVEGGGLRSLEVRPEEFCSRVVSVFAADVRG